jgi:hypothetical protein
MERWVIDTSMATWSTTMSPISLATAAATRRSLALNYNASRSEWFLAWAEATRVAGIAISERTGHANQETVLFTAPAGNDVIGSLTIAPSSTGHSGVVITRTAGRDGLMSFQFGCSP